MSRPGAVELWFELETRCNLSCPFCYNYWKYDRAGPPARVATERLVAGLNQLLDRMPCDRVAISGGEPLLHDDLFDILAVFQDRGVPMTLATNGVLLTPALIERLIE